MSILVNHPFSEIKAGDRVLLMRRLSARAVYHRRGAEPDARPGHQARHPAGAGRQAGNMLAKLLDYLGGAQMAGIVLVEIRTDGLQDAAAGLQAAHADDAVDADFKDVSQ